MKLGLGVVGLSLVNGLSAKMEDCWVVNWRDCVSIDCNRHG